MRSCASRRAGAARRHARLCGLHERARLGAGRSAGSDRVRWRTEHDGREHELTLDARAGDDDVVLARLTGLAPGSRAAYTSTATATGAKASLRAQPYWTNGDDAPDITIAIGSCFFLAAAEAPWNASTYGGGYEIFDAIAAKAPDLMVWIGDNLYFQPPDDSIRHRWPRAIAGSARSVAAAAARRRRRNLRSGTTTITDRTTPTCRTC